MIILDENLLRLKLCSIDRGITILKSKCMLPPKKRFGKECRLYLRSEFLNQVVVLIGVKCDAYHSALFWSP